MKFVTPHAYLRILPKKGRCVFAACNFRKDQIIEVSPVIPFEVSEVNKETFALWDYQLAWRGSKDAVGLGYLMLYNHADDSNVSFSRDFKDKCITVRAKRPIAKDEELTVRYCCPLWFKEIK